MQKKIIALAVAGLVSGAAFAQSNVVIYGAADVTYDNVKATSGATPATSQYERRGRTTMNSAFIGFKGTEDLGGGLKAVFQFESGINENAGATNFNAASSTNGWANRDTFVGLSGGFGTIVGGNLTGPARALGAAMDVNSGATGIGANTALIGKLGGGGGAGYFDQRFSNTLAYISPTFAGFNGVVAYVPNENRSSNTSAAPAIAVDTSAWTVGLNYNQGPVMVGFAHTNVKDKGATGLGLAATGLGAVNIDKASNNRLAGKFNFGMGTVGLMWDQSKATLNAGVADAKQTVWYVPVTFNVGAGKIIGQYGTARQPSGSGIAAGTDYRAKHYEIGYEHSLSKRTIVKALYSQITNQKDATYDFLYGVSNPNSTGQGLGVGSGTDPKGFSIGVRHSF